MTPLRRSLSGIFLLVSSNAFSILNDALVKLLATSLAIGQIVALRGAVILTLTLGIVLITGQFGKLRLALSGKVLARALCEGCAALLYVVALANTSISTIVAIYLIVPVCTTAGAVIFLGEQVGPRSWLAVAVGLLGATLVVNPATAEINVYVFCVFGAVILTAGRDLIARRIDPVVPSIVVTFASILLVSIAGLIAGLSEAWAAPQPRDGVLIIAAAVLAGTGMQFVFLAYRTAEASIVAPFRYTSILWAILISYLFWGEVPNGRMMLGILVISLAGLYIVHRERVTGRPDVSLLAQTSTLSAGIDVGRDSEVDKSLSSVRNQG